MSSAQIAQLKGVVKAIGSLTDVISDLSDGISFSEISKILGTVGDIRMILGDIALTIPNWESLTDADRGELQSYAVTVIEFEANVKVEEAVEKIVKAAIALSAVYQAVK